MRRPSHSCWCTGRGPPSGSMAHVLPSPAQPPLLVRMLRAMQGAAGWCCGRSAGGMVPDGSCKRPTGWHPRQLPGSPMPQSGPASGNSRLCCCTSVPGLVTYEGSEQWCSSAHWSGERSTSFSHAWNLSAQQLERCPEKHSVSPDPREPSPHGRCSFSGSLRSAQQQ